MFTVIIPTMWRGQEMVRMLPAVHDHPLVGEIMLINNNKKITPDWYLNGNWTKVKQYAPEDNIGVNPAWNIGIQNAQYEKILLLSDDVLFTTSLLDFIHPHVTEENGCIGPHSVNTPAKGPYRLQKAERMRGQYGCCLFLHKNNFDFIPKEFIIYYGDNWIFRTHVLKGKQPMFIENSNISTPVMATSSLGVFKKQADEEHKTWKKMFKGEFTTEP